MYQEIGIILSINLYFKEHILLLILYFWCFSGARKKLEEIGFQMKKIEF